MDRGRSPAAFSVHRIAGRQESPRSGSRTPRELTLRASLLSSFPRLCGGHTFGRCLLSRARLGFPDSRLCWLRALFLFSRFTSGGHQRRKFSRGFADCRRGLYQDTVCVWGSNFFLRHAIQFKGYRATSQGRTELLFPPQRDK